MSEASKTNAGLVSVRSPFSVDETTRRLAHALDAKGATVFATVDHSGAATKIGLEMRPTRVLIFGNPRAGTPLMIAAPSLAIDLPLKILIAEAPDGHVWMSYNTAEYLGRRHGLDSTMWQSLAVVESLVASIAGAPIGGV